MVEAAALYFDRAKVERRLPLSRVSSEDITIHITSERWIVIVRRNGKIVEIIRFPPRGPASDVLRTLRALESLGALDASQRIHDPRTARALGQALDDVADALPQGPGR